MTLGQNGWARLGSARQGWARRGVAWPGAAWLGRARQGKARQGFPKVTEFSPLDKIIAAEAKLYDRERNLSPLLQRCGNALWPHELTDYTTDGRRRILRKIERSCRMLRQMARARPHQYEMNTHVALLAAHTAERDALADQMRSENTLALSSIAKATDEFRAAVRGEAQVAGAMTATTQFARLTGSANQSPERQMKQRNANGTLR